MASRVLMVALAGLLPFGLAARAADFSEASPDAPVPLATPAPTTTFSFEVGPNFDAADKSPGPPAGTLANVFGKLGLSHSFAGGWVVSGSFQPQINTESDGGDTYRYYVEGDLGYKFRLGNGLTLVSTAGIGEVWGSTGITPSDPSALYYALYLAGDWKLSSNWTWNVFDARYRDAFDFTWVTPKIATGLTYEINPQNSVFANVGYSWKDTGAGLKPDEIGLGLGYKHGF